MRWIKKPDRKDRLWFLAWPIEVKLGTDAERGMDTDHTLYIWGEWVRIVVDEGYESRCRITTRDENGFDYYGSYFKKFKGYIHAAKWTCFWVGLGSAVAGAVVALSQMMT